jgi:thiol-disulfide isomerase/thioredoxin
MFTSHHTLSRRAFLGGMLAASLVPLAACGAPEAGADTSAEAPAPVTFDSLPEGIGRGYPLASLDGIDNAGTGVEPGDLAPNFRMLFDDGELTLHDLAGRPIILNFWATWCGPCQIEMPEIVSQAVANPDLIVIAVNLQEKLEQIRSFAEEFAMDLIIVRDEQGAVRTAYQARGLPTSFFLDRQGRVAVNWPGILTPDHLATNLEAIL